MNSSTYTTNNSFSSNLNASLFSLYANATHKDGLYTTNAGQNLYYMGSSYVDTSPKLCQSYIKTWRYHVEEIPPLSYHSCIKGFVWPALVL